MATSNNISWELTRNEILEAALRKVGALAEGQTISANQIATGAQALNAVIALMVTDGMPLWKRTTVAIPLVLAQVAYSLPAGAIKLAQVILQDTASGTQYDLIQKSLYDLNRLPTDSSGQPVHYTYQPTLAAGTLTIWPKPDSGAVSTKTLAAIYQRKFDGFFASGETPDFPAYWTMPIIYKLAQSLAPEYGLPIQDRQMLAGEAKMLVDAANGYGDEDGSYYIQPERMCW